jgi:hypothetical protein
MIQYWDDPDNTTHHDLAVKIQELVHGVNMLIWFASRLDPILWAQVTKDYKNKVEE